MNGGSCSESGSASRRPRTDCGSRENCSSGCDNVPGSRGSGAASASSISAQSRTHLANGPIESRVQLRSPVACRLMRPKVTFSPDSRWLAYGARVDKPWTVVLNGQEGKPYENLISLGGGRLVFDAPDRLHYLVTRGQDIYVVQEQLK